MATTFAVENAKTLRKALDRIEITVKDSVSGSTIFTFTRNDIISCVLSLKGTETKLDNPELQASTIEIEAYYTGTEASIRALRGKDTVIKYRAGYAGSGSDFSPERTFYASFDADGLKLDRHVLRIKGTDMVGTIADQNDGEMVKDYYYSAEYRYLRHLIAKYEYTIGRPFLEMNPVVWLCEDYDEYKGIPDMRIQKANYNDVDKNAILIEPKSRRKLIAQLMNIFRGSNPSNPDRFAPRFVFRDAGIPVIGWGTTAIASWQAAAGKTMRTWELDYNDLTDVECEYGNPVKQVKMDNPGVDIDDSENEMEALTFDRPCSKLLTFTEPTQMSSYVIKTHGKYGIAGSTTLSTRAVSVRAAESPSGGSGPTVVIPYYRKISRVYDGAESAPTITINTGLSYGDVIQLDEFIGLHKMTGEYNGATYTDLNIIERGLTAALNDCGLKQPKWINFKWRGNTYMQPRDMIILTEADGSRNYYEIDNLTLEHRGGALTSQVKAIYKCPYTGG